MAPYRQSNEIKSLSLAGHDVPVNKERRHGDAEEKATLAGRRKYTWNVDEMVPLARFGKKDDNRCDVCGASCTEVLFGVLHSQLRECSDDVCVCSFSRFGFCVCVCARACADRTPTKK